MRKSIKRKEEKNYRTEERRRRDEGERKEWEV